MVVRVESEVRVAALHHRDRTRLPIPDTQLASCPTHRGDGGHRGRVCVGGSSSFGRDPARSRAPGAITRVRNRSVSTAGAPPWTRDRWGCPHRGAPVDNRWKGLCVASWAPVLGPQTSRIRCVASFWRSQMGYLRCLVRGRSGFSSRNWACLLGRNEPTCWRKPKRRLDASEFGAQHGDRSLVEARLRSAGPAYGSKSETRTSASRTPSRTSGMSSASMAVMERA